MGTIRENLNEIMGRIENAAKRSGRQADQITLVAVSKFVDAERVREAAACGVRNFGENYVQECLTKTFLAEEDEIHFHFIGHLQKNKIKYILDKVSMIQSADSIGLVQELSRLADARGLTAEALLQVNIGYEDTKSGVSPEELPALLSAAEKLPALRIRGLMAIPPAEKEPGDVRKYFEKMRRLFEACRRETGAEFDTLSMGMSGDFEEAICEGSTMVRIGTAVFGQRSIK